MKINQLIKCYHPFIYESNIKKISLYEKQSDQFNSKYDSLKHFINTGSVLIGCGKCKFCLQKKQSRLSNYVNNQISQCKYNYLITLTFDNVHIIKNLDYVSSSPNEHEIKRGLYTSISKNQIQNIIKNWKNKFNRFYESKIKLNYFLCGEYGSNTHRAHYHIYLGCNVPIPHLKNVTDNHYTSSFIRSKQYGFFDIELINCNSKNVGFYLTKYLSKSFNKQSILDKTVKLNLDQEKKELKQFGFLFISQKPFYKKSRGLGLFNNFDLDLKANNLTRYYLTKLINQYIVNISLDYNFQVKLGFDLNNFKHVFLKLQNDYFDNYYSNYYDCYSYFCSKLFKLKNFGYSKYDIFYQSLKKWFPELFDIFNKLFNQKLAGLSVPLNYYEKHSKKSYEYDLF